MRPTKAIINLSAIQHNLSVVRKLAPNCKIMAVIKADAYGHGIVSVAKALNGVDSLAVACLDEAIKLRQANIDSPIILLEGFYDREELKQVFVHGLETVLHQQEQVEQLFDYLHNLRPKSKIKKLTVWLKLDTGMNRLGFSEAEYQEVYESLINNEFIESINLMSHFACADDINHSMNQVQINKFKTACRELIGQKSMANSAAIIAWPESHFDWIRPGIALFGCSPLANYDGLAHHFLPAMTLKSKVLALHSVEAGETVGYGASWQASKKTKIGVIAIGYGDGYPRHATQGTPILVKGKTYPLIGKVSMDMLTIDLGLDENIKVGDDVTLWGEGLAVEKIASFANTIPYTLLCGVTSRVNFEWV